MSEDLESTNNDDEEVEYVYGIPMRPLPEGLQPLECIVIIKGMYMENGDATMTSIGSEGLIPWEVVGMLEMEAQRIKMHYIVDVVASYEDEEEG